MRIPIQHDNHTLKVTFNVLFIYILTMGFLYDFGLPKLRLPELVFLFLLPIFIYELLKNESIVILRSLWNEIDVALLIYFAALSIANIASGHKHSILLLSSTFYLLIAYFLVRTIVYFRLKKAKILRGLSQ